MRDEGGYESEMRTVAKCLVPNESKLLSVAAGVLECGH